MLEDLTSPIAGQVHAPLMSHHCRISIPDYGNDHFSVLSTAQIRVNYRPKSEAFRTVVWLKQPLMIERLFNSTRLNYCFFGNACNTKLTNNADAWRESKF